MTRRAVLYGYQIKSGAFILDPDKAQIVRRIFELYQMGESYSRIADTLNGEGTPYLLEKPVWNKHLIKRILQNPKYTGDGVYPALIPIEQYQNVQNMIQEKAAVYCRKAPREDEKIWGFLTCGACHGELKRIGGGPKDKSCIYLRCQSCGQRIAISKGDLVREILCQYNAHTSEPKDQYEPSEELIRLDNTINRGLESPEDPKAIIQTILQAASARYGCCKTVQGLPAVQQINDMDWKVFQRNVKTVQISSEIQIMLLFQDEE